MEASSAPTKYEFSVTENVVLGGTARWVGIWAWFGIVGGVLTAVSGVFTLPAGIVNLAIGIIYLIVGMYFRGAAQSLHSVVATAGSDINHLMAAMQSLKSAFKVMVIVTGIGLALAILAVVVGLATMGAGLTAGG